MSHEIIMPALGMAQDTAVIIAWHKQPGDAVKADDVLMEVETDKATMEVEAGHDGFVVELRAEVDVPVPVGVVIAIIAADATAVVTTEISSDVAAEQAMDSSSKEACTRSSDSSQARPQTQLETNHQAGAEARAGMRILASPKAQFEAQQRGIDLAELIRQGATEPLHMADLEALSGVSRIASASPKVRKLAREKDIDLDQLATRLGRDQIALDDVLNLAGKSTSDAASTSAITRSTNSDASLSKFWDVDHSQYGEVELTDLPRATQFAATNLTAAQQLIPAVTHHDRVAVDELEKIRTDLMEDSSDSDVRLTALAFHTKALAKALQAFPRFNASLSVDGTGLWVKKYVDVGIAVDTSYGLKVVAVRGCDEKSLLEIATDIQALATRARSRKIRPAEMGGAGMSITNLGARGPNFFTPIINPPEVAILGLSRTSLEPVWNGNAFEPSRMTPLSLTYDHRIINGADAVDFLDFYKEQLLKPWRLLV